MKLRMTQANLEPSVMVMAADGQPATDQNAIREQLLSEFRAGRLHKLRFSATTWTDGPNKNHFRFPPEELPAFAKSFVGAPFLKDHAHEIDSVGGTIIASELSADGHAIRQQFEAVEPWAIGGLLNGKIKRFSIGWDATGHLCTVCNDDILDCKHGPWGIGKTDAEKKTVVGVEWTGIEGIETSAVTHPAAPGTRTEEVMAQLAKLAQQRIEAGISPEKEKEVHVKEKVFALLGLPANTAEAEALAALEGRLAQSVKCPKCGAEFTPKGMSAVPNALRTALGLTENAGEDEVIAKVVSLTAPGNFVPKAEHDTTVDELATLKATEKVRTAKAAGKITPAMEAWALEFAKRDPASFDAYLKHAPTQVPLPGSGVEPPVIDDSKKPKALNAEEAMVAQRLGLTPDEWLKVKGEVAAADARHAALYGSN